MNDTTRQILPVGISVLVIIGIAVLRAHSKTLAAITVTMPLNIPLAVWIIYSTEGRSPMPTFTGSLLAGLGATVIFTVALWLAAKAGLGLVPMLGVAYLAWAATLGGRIRAAQLRVMKRWEN
jgi:hypothetical protein